MISLIILQTTSMADPSTMLLYAAEIVGMLLGAFVLGYLLRYFTVVSPAASSADRLENKLQKEPVREAKTPTTSYTASNSSSSELSKLKSELAEANALVASLRAKPDNSATLNTINKELSLKITEVVSLKTEIATLKAELEAYAPAPKTSTAGMPTSTGTFGAKDELKKLEGIGPKIQQILYDAGISTYKQLADTSVDKLKEILLATGERYRLHDPSSWPKQAALAADNKWDELKELQKNLLTDND